MQYLILLLLIFVAVAIIVTLLPPPPNPPGITEGTIGGGPIGIGDWLSVIEDAEKTDGGGDSDCM